MNKQEYENWKDFAERMAKTCFKMRRNPMWRDILANVEFFFDCLDEEDIQCIENWDHSNPYPIGSKYYSRTYKTSCWHCNGNKKPDCKYNCEDGRIYDYAKPMCVGDMCSEHSESWNPYYWSGLSDDQHEKHQEQFCGPVTCCIRAGLDMAVAPSGGVLGFTAGDIRRMYPEGVPDWITGGVDHRWSYWMEDKMNGTFAEMPESAGLVL